MKRALKTLTSLLSAAAVASAGLISAGAQNYYGQLDVESSSVTHTQTIRTNKPYLNITLDKGDVDASGIVFYMYKDDNTYIGNFPFDMSRFYFADMQNTYTDAASGQTIYDITGASSDEELLEKLASCGGYAETVFERKSTSELTSGRTPLSVNPNGVKTSIDEKVWDKLIIYPNSSCYFGYFDWEKYPVVDRMTIPAGTVALNVSDVYSWRQDDSLLELLDPDDMESPKFSRELNRSASKELISVGSAGEYMLSLRGKYSKENSDVVVSDISESYVKIRVPVSALEDADPNGFITAPSGERYNLDWVWGSNVSSFCFVSGAAVSCDKLTEGFVEIWVKESDPYTIMHYTLYDKDSGNIDDFSTRTNVRYELRYDRVDTEMPYPENGGITLYNVPAGKYRIEMYNQEHELLGDTSVTVMNSQDMYHLDLTIRAKQTEEPPTDDDPTVDDPTTDDPPTDVPPTDDPSGDTPPTVDPPSGNTPPTNDPSGNTPPTADPPSTDTPTTNDPSGDTPSGGSTGSGSYTPSQSENNQGSTTDVTKDPAQDQKPAPTGTASASLAIAAVGAASAVAVRKRKS